MTEQLQIDLESYREQLSQVDQAIQYGPSDESLIELKGQMQQLIELTEQNLLEAKKKELLGLLEEQTEPEESVQETKETVEEIEETVQNEIGKKCSAPFLSKTLGKSSFHNAVIFSNEGNDLVRVIFSNPVEVGMVSCPFFIDGRCKFQENKCRYSHGEIVKIADLREYSSPDYTKIQEGSSILAKSNKSQLWKHTTVDMICGDEVSVKWSENEVENLPLSQIFPLSTSKEDKEIELKPIAEDVIIHIQPSASRLGSWEEHTRGIGSKLMAKMGYIFGSGLGKASDGRVEPVPTKVYPSGKSLDWIHENQQKVQVVDKTKESKKPQKPAEENSVFDLVNAACSSRRSKSIQVKNVDESKESLNVQGFKVDQEIVRLRKEIQKAEMAAVQHKKDPKTFAHLELKVKSLKDRLKALQRRSSSVEDEKKRSRERQQLVKF